MPIYNLHFEIFRNILKCVPGCFHISRTKVYKSVFVMHGQQYIRTNSLYMFKIIYTNDLFYLLSILKRYLHGLTLNHCLGISSFFSYTKSTMSTAYFLTYVIVIKLLALQFTGYVVMLLRLEEMVMTLKEKQKGLLVMTILCYLE